RSDVGLTARHPFKPKIALRQSDVSETGETGALRFPGGRPQGGEDKGKLRQRRAEAQRVRPYPADRISSHQHSKAPAHRAAASNSRSRSGRASWMSLKAA